ncbi:MAG: hypothetical protein ABTD50_09010 [Polyangiaceae bacterium]|jgi:hypothetical protein
MSGSVTLDVATHQHADIKFKAVVIVTGAPQGATVTVTLSETRGRPPLWGPISKVSAAAAGSATLTFDVALKGPTLAVLLAEATDDKNTDYASDAERIEVF